MAPRRKQQINNYRGKNFTVQEEAELIEVIAKYRPISREDWSKVAEEHEAAWPTGRTVVSIRKKFNNLHRKAIPTGDPACPPHIKRAKRIQRLIVRKCELAVGDDYQKSDNEQEDEEYVEDGGSDDGNIEEEVVDTVDNDGNDEEEDAENEEEEEKEEDRTPAARRLNLERESVVALSNGMSLNMSDKTTPADVSVDNQ